MARTRSQAQPGNQAANGTSSNVKAPKKDAVPKQAKQPPSQKRKRDAAHDVKEASPKKSQRKEEPAEQASTKPGKTHDDSKLEKVISTYGSLPLQDVGLPEASSPTPDTILALVLHAMLTSARISHELAYNSVKCLIEAGYHNLDTLLKSSWQERTEVLTKGGYTHYREKTATGLGELAEFVKDKYDGDLNNLLKKADSPSQVRDLLKEVKGLGNVGLDIFFDTAQQVWPSLAPFVDPRSLKTAEQIGVGDDVQGLWEQVGKDAKEMCKLSSALTTIRLEKKEKDFA